MVATQIHTYYCCAHKHSAATDDPLRQVKIHDSVENTHQKRSACGFDPCPSFKPCFSQVERARQPRNCLNGDGVDEGSDVQGPQDGAAACHHPAKQHPTAPQQVQEQDGLHEEENGNSASNAIMLPCLPYRKAWR